MCKEGVLGPEKYSRGISTALNFSVNPELNTYKEAATASTFHVTEIDAVLVEIGVILHFIEYILS